MQRFFIIDRANPAGSYETDTLPQHLALELIQGANVFVLVLQPTPEAATVLWDGVKFVPVPFRRQAEVVLTPAEADAAWRAELERAGHRKARPDPLLVALEEQAAKTCRTGHVSAPPPDPFGQTLTAPGFPHNQRTEVAVPPDNQIT